MKIILKLFRCFFFSSAKIARLEDEIEQLKELTELKKQRDRLKKKSKK